MFPEISPYQPQRPTPLPIEPRGFFTGVKIRPVIVGAVVDYVATFVLVMLYLIFYYMKEPFEKGGLPEEAIEKALNEMLSSQEGLIALIVIGAFCTGLGGYLAARLAKAEEVKHGALVGAVALIVGVLQTAMAGEASPVPQFYQFLGYALAIPAGALGGSLAQGRSSSSMPGSTKRLTPG
jgi:putative membrane protein (TIGR04086 family)